MKSANEHLGKLEANLRTVRLEKREFLGGAKGQTVIQELAKVRLQL